jgi:uncharacterized surface protein with fasciclin (FAS1) repeats
MNKRMISLGLAAGLIALAGCNKNQDGKEAAANGTEAVKKAGDKTIAASLEANSKYATLAKAAGLDLTLQGAGPYTVFVPDDAAFDKLPAGTTDNWTKPEGRPELTRTLTYSILPGTVLAEDIAKAIENGKGKAELATMGGEVLTATKDGGKIVLTDAAGGKATVTRADDTMANGVIHHTDAVLMPNKPS